MVRKTSCPFSTAGYDRRYLLAAAPWNEGLADVYRGAWELLHVTYYEDEAKEVNTRQEEYMTALVVAHGLGPNFHNVLADMRGPYGQPGQAERRAAASSAQAAVEVKEAGSNCGAQEEKDEPPDDGGEPASSVSAA